MVAWRGGGGVCLLGSIKSWVSSHQPQTKELFSAINWLSDSNSRDIQFHLDHRLLVLLDHFVHYRVRARSLFLNERNQRPTISMFAAKTINGDARHTIYRFHLINVQMKWNALRGWWSIPHVPNNSFTYSILQVHYLPSCDCIAIWPTEMPRDSFCVGWLADWLDTRNGFAKYLWSMDLPKRFIRILIHRIVYKCTINWPKPLYGLMRE